MYPSVNSSTALTTNPSALLSTSQDPSPSPIPITDDPDVYSIKTIPFLNREVTIIMQNMNGPCPLLAIANALLLRGTMKNIPSSTISNDHLLHLVADIIVESNSNITQNPKPSVTNNEQELLLGKNIQHSIDAVMADTLPILKNGELFLFIIHLITFFFAFFPFLLLFCFDSSNELDLLNKENEREYAQ